MFSIYATAHHHLAFDAGWFLRRPGGLACWHEYPAGCDIDAKPWHEACMVYLGHDKVPPWLQSRSAQAAWGFRLAAAETQLHVRTQHVCGHIKNQHRARRHQPAGHP